jgi:uncharacterized membrane protein
MRAQDSSVRARQIPVSVPRIPTDFTCGTGIEDASREFTLPSRPGGPGSPTLPAMNDWHSYLLRWSEAGLIDASTADQIRAFEQTHAGTRKLRWPVLIALAFGGLMVCGGVLLFVAAHWDALSPAMRFSLVIAMVGGFHGAAALTAERFPAMATTLHAVGTVALGGGIALAGQVFNLDEHWPGGVLMWSAGAAAAWFILRQVPQLAMVAILVPTWLVSEWIVATMTQPERAATRVAACGLFLCSLTYLSSVTGARSDDWRRALKWIGGLALPPAALVLAIATSRGFWYFDSTGVILSRLYLIGWAIALGLPIGLAVWLRGKDAWMNALASLWVVVLVVMVPIADNIVRYPWWALGAIGLVAWGVRDARSERVNLGAALFATTVVAFYFSQVMDKLGRSASLVGLGLLFLAGGWALERVRRRLVLQARGAA